MTIGGNLDFGGQASQGTRFLTALAVDTVGAQSFDISSLVGPQDLALLVYWVGTAPFSGLPCGVIAQTNAPPIFFSGHTQLQDGGQAILPFMGAVMLYPVNIGGTIIVDNIGPGPIHIVGTLFVLALTSPPYAIPVVRGVYGGVGHNSGLISVAGGATTTIVPDPSSGTYYRIKCLNWSGFVAPAAVAGIQFERTDDFTVIWEGARAVVAVQGESTNPDMHLPAGIRVHNFSSQAVFITIMYEIWQA